MIKKIVVLFLLSFPVFIYSSSLDWTSVNGNQYLTANNDEIVPTENIVNWKFQAPANIYYPIPVQDKIFLSSLDHNVYCLNASTGAMLWKHLTTSPLIRSIVVKGNHVIVPSGTVIRNLNLNSGDLLWARDEQPNNIYIYPVIVDNKVIYGTRKAMICRELSTGRLIWQNNNINIFGGSASAYDNIVVVQSRHYSEKRYTVTALDLRTGSLLWENEITPDSSIFTPVIFNKNVYVSSKNTLYSMDIVSGHKNWVKQLNFNISSECVFANGNLHFAAEGGFIVIVEPETGDTIETISFKPGRVPFSLVGDNMFVLEHSSGNIFKVDLINYSKNLFWKDEENISGGHQIAIADGVIYLPKNNTLTAVGNKVEKILIATASKNKIIKGKIIDEYGNPVNAEIYLPLQNKKINTSEGVFSFPFPESDFPLKVDLTASNKMYKTVVIDRSNSEITISMESISKQKSFSLDNIYFDFDRADLKASAIPIIMNVHDFLIKNPQVKLEIRGHTDDEGDKAYNLKLSQRRADRVKQFLVKNEIQEQHLSSIGLGESFPLNTNSAPTDKALNRRIEFVIK